MSDRLSGYRIFPSSSLNPILSNNLERELLFHPQVDKTLGEGHILFMSKTDKNPYSLSIRTSP